MSIFAKLKDIMGADDDDFENDDVDFIGNQAHNMDDDYSAEKRNKVVNINATTSLKVVLVKPERFDDASGVADHLNARRTVVLNLEATNKEVSRRLVDFLTGVTYANNGTIKRVASNIFIITPHNVDIVGDILEELESSGVFF